MPRLLRFALRDGLIAAVTLALWAAVLAGRGQAGAAPVALNVLTGLLTVLLGYLVHEWGHLAGCAWRGSAVRLPERITSAFLFNFDLSRNDRRQFNAMAMGGFVASALYVAVLLLAIPRDLLAGKIALALAVLGVLATFVLEVPTAWRVWRGGPLPQQGPAFVPATPASPRS